MTKTNQYYYDKLRDCYNLVCEEEYKKKNPPSKPIKRQNFGKGRPVQPGRDVYADTNPNASRIRLQHKDWDEAHEQPKRKTLKEFLVDAGSTATPTKQDKKYLEYMHQVFLAGKNIENFEDFIGFINYLTP